MGKDVINVGVIGFGTVGSGTVKLLINNKDVIRDRLGFEVNLKTVADKDTKTDRGIRLPEGMLVDSADAVLGDPDIDIVVELVGGYTFAKDVMLRAIRAGKSVVTANKALLAVHGAEIFKEAAAKGVDVGFEASVAGGIPIIKVIREGLIANRFLSVFGIVNGTTNYILTKMTSEGSDFKDVLGEAQRLGYAEADPTFDIEGVDAAHKLTILGTLAFGLPLSFDQVYKEGITKITALDIAYAKEFGYKIKLLAVAKAVDGEVELRVNPTMVPQDYLISKVDGVFNAVYVKGDFVGDTMYYGRGAGDLPTASAVVADIAEIAASIRGGYRRRPLYVSPNPPRIKKIEEISTKYFLRFSALDKPGVLSRIAGTLGAHSISIASMIQKGRSDGEAVPVVILTHMAREKDVRDALAEIDAMPVIAEKTLLLRVEGDE